MILYFVRKYLIHFVVFAAALAVLPLTRMGLPLRVAGPRALFWASFLAAASVYWEFRRHQIWPLFDNLRLSKPMMLGSTIAAGIALAGAARWWLS